jgi:ribose/xylose/arabinose/galactoside ABC-type transport system permease subunit
MNTKMIVRKILQNGAYILLFLTCIVLACLDSNFLTMGNLINVALQSSIIGILALGMTFVICTGNIDISVGNGIGVCSAVGIALVMFYGCPWWLSMLAMIGVGCLLGVVNGVCVAYMKIPSMLVTLATQCIAAGLVLVISQGKSWLDLPRQFTAISKNKLLGIPWLLWIVLLLYAVCHFILSCTVYGRKVLAVGGNPDSAKASGIHTERVVAGAYILCGCVVGIAGILQTGRLGAFYASMGAGMEMNVIAATVIGGTCMTGGRGTIVGTLAGVLLMGVINNALNLLGVDANWQSVARGIIILIAVIIDAVRVRYEQES